MRPLASTVAKTITEAFGWSVPYTRGILERWKKREAYCRAVLIYPKRISIDGTQSEEDVNDIARANAKEHVERLQAKRRAVLAERVAQDVATRGEPNASP